MTTFVLGGLAIMLATTLAGVMGFAYGLVALPLLIALGIPLADAVVVNLTVALVTRIATLWQLRQAVDVRRASVLVLACVPGLATGVWVRDLVDTDVIELAAGVITVTAAVVLMRDTGRDLPNGDRRGPLLAAGALGGFLGATTSLNGIPPAVVFTYFQERARTIVADLAVYFVAGNTLTLAVLGATGNVSVDRAVPYVAAWLPGAVLGNLTGVALGSRIPYVVFRRLTLLVIFVSGALAFVSNL